MGAKSSAVLSSKSQITIPAWIRRRLGIGPGARLAFRVEGDKVVLERAPVDLSEIRGSMKGAFGSDPDSFIREIRAEWDRGY